MLFFASFRVASATFPVLPSETIILKGCDSHFACNASLHQYRIVFFSFSPAIGRIATIPNGFEQILHHLSYSCPADRPVNKSLYGRGHGPSLTPKISKRNANSMIMFASSGDAE